MKKSFLLYVLLHLSWSFSQITFYQDIFKGGISAGGFSTGLGSGSGTVNLYIEPGSIIRKAFIICQRFQSPPPSVIEVNGIDYLFKSDNEVTSFMINNSFHNFNSGVHVLDITNYINPNETSFLISIDNYTGDSEIVYNSPFLIILYENPNLPLVNTTIILNSTNLEETQNKVYNIVGLNSIDNSNPVSFSVHSDRIGDSIVNDGSYVYFNSNLLGLIGGTDLVNDSWPGAGVKGHFYYQNNQLFGLDDDTPDEVMSESDALANISNILLNNATSCDFNFLWQDENATFRYNIYTSFSITYTSPCSAFPTQTSSDTTLCFGTTAQLFASGGGSGGTLPAYEWQPAVGLSCTDCPNPIVTADSSRLYTVRIRNNDSCSVVRPIKVNVKPLPEFSSVVSKPSICGAATGQILLGADYVGETYSINGGTPQTSGTFSNLSAGTYTVSLHELNGCTRDTLVVVGDTSLTQAYFTATPQSGAAPLWVQFSNQSTNANDFSWSVNGEPQGGNLTSFSFDTNGVYTVELVAWQFDPSCADTFSVLISVYDSLVVQIPNVFTPNHDGNNDFFGVTVNRPCAISFSILNRWGNVIQSGTVPTSGGFVPLWSGSTAPYGTYFYQIELQADDLKQVEKREGFVELR